MNKVARKIAEVMFGKQNLKNISKEMLSMNALVIFCKDSERAPSFSGTTINGFDFMFCNSTQTIQTDVGFCTANNPMQYMKDGKIYQNVGRTLKIEEELKDVEHIMILSPDKFGEKNDPNFKVKHLFQIPT